MPLRVYKSTGKISVPWLYRELVSVQHNVKSDLLSLAAIKPPQTTITSLWPKELRILGHDTKGSCTIQVTKDLSFSIADS